MITKIFDDIQQTLTMVMTAEGQSDVPSFYFGARELSTGDTYPRFVMVPKGGRVDKGKSNSNDERKTPRILWTRFFHCDIHLWAKDDTALEVLMNDVVRAFEAYMPGSYTVVSEFWDTATSLSNGVYGLLTVELRQPFFSTRLAFVKPDRVTPSGTFEESLS